MTYSGGFGHVQTNKDGHHCHQQHIAKRSWRWGHTATTLMLAANHAGVCEQAGSDAAGGKGQ